MQNTENVNFGVYVLLRLVALTVVCDLQVLAALLQVYATPERTKTEVQYITSSYFRGV